MESLKLIQREFKRLTLLFLPKRQTNQLEDKVQRKDSVFPFLADIVFDHPRLLTVLKKKIKYWLKLNKSETIFALAGYIHYLDNNFIKSENYFCKCVEQNPKNIDNWVDLIFSLYHQGDKKNRIAKAILFNFDLFVKRFRRIKNGKCNLTILERIYKELKKEKKDYVHLWRKYIYDK